MNRFNNYENFAVKTEG